MIPDRPAPTDEIEITPAMIEAGVDELMGHDIYMSSDLTGPSMDNWREAVRDCFLAMARASRHI